MIRIVGILHEDLHTYMITSHRIILGMRNVSDKIYRENQETHFVYSNLFPKLLPLIR